MMKVLVADGDSPCRRLFSSLLARWGYEVISVGDGEAAWLEIQQIDPPRLLLLNWILPLVDGAEICRRIRETTAFSPCYIILYSIKDTAEDRVAGLECGANHYMTLPVDRLDLQEQVRVGAQALAAMTSIHTDQVARP